MSAKQKIKNILKRNLIFLRFKSGQYQSNFFNSYALFLFIMLDITENGKVNLDLISNINIKSSIRLKQAWSFKLVHSLYEKRSLPSIGIVNRLILL